MSGTGPVVGFDLDMTLVDSAAGIGATLRAALRQADGPHALQPTDDEVWPWIGLPLERMVAALSPESDSAAVAVTYRSAYSRIGVPLTRCLPGAEAAIDAVRAAGGRVLLVSAKAPAGVEAVLEAAGLTGARRPDVVAGGLFADAKADVLLAETAHAYVGDHPADVTAAKLAGAIAVGVGTGPVPSAELVAAGADTVLPDLRAFPAWLAATLFTAGTAPADAPAGALELPGEAVRALPPGETDGVRVD